MPFARIRELSHRLRVRLALWYGGAFAALLAAAALIVFQSLKLELIGETDFRLLEDAKETAQAVAQYHPDAEMIMGMLARKADNHTHERLFLEWLDADGRTLWQGRETPAETKLLELGFTGVREVGAFRVAQRTVDAAGGVPAYVVRVGASLEQINAAAWRRTRIMILVGSATMVLAILGAYWIAGSAIRPVTVIIETAERLRPSYLEERLPIRGTGDELEQLSRTINAFLDRIAEYLAKKREFVANAAHELRSPLAAIRSSVDVALATRRTSEEYEALLETIAEECAQLTTLVNQLLLLTETDGGRNLRFSESLRLDRLVENGVEMFRGVAEERGVALETGLHDAGRVFGNAARLRQAVNNLLDNAIKFTDVGGRVRIDLEAVAGERRVRLRVGDSGIGIAPQDVPFVFDRFFRGGKGREREGASRGTGLGLAITKAVIEEHGGTIDVESELGRGSTFTVTLPADDRRTPIADDAVPTAAESAA
jgi:heavy metal sensor kinase